MAGQALHETLPITDFAAGVAAGAATETVAMGVWWHLHLAHETVTTVHPTVATASRYALVMAGMSPNRTAFHHRNHHALDTMPANTVTGAIAHVRASSSGASTDDAAADTVTLFPNFPLEADTLLKPTTKGRAAFRQDPPLEKFIGKGTPQRFIPVLATVAALAVRNKYSGRDHPIRRALAFEGGYLAGFSLSAILTSAAEGRAGYKDGEFDYSRVPRPLHPQLRRHQAHHNQPAQVEVGLNFRHRMGLRLLKRLGLIDY